MAGENAPKSTAQARKASPRAIDLVPDAREGAAMIIRRVHATLAACSAVPVSAEKAAEEATILLSLAEAANKAFDLLQKAGSEANMVGRFK